MHVYLIEYDTNGCCSLQIDIISMLSIYTYRYLIRSMLGNECAKSSYVIPRVCVGCLVNSKLIFR